uniref:Uncharacterized protein n=1 Tax=uncultured marine virus TaxID=186617 RepID=A0A0F7LAZ7_9VIRU|nr:hypothetical protein [uncultured marine virus]
MTQRARQYAFSIPVRVSSVLRRITSERRFVQTAPVVLAGSRNHSHTLSVASPAAKAAVSGSLDAGGSASAR